MAQLDAAKRVHFSVCLALVCSLADDRTSKVLVSTTHLGMCHNFVVVLVSTRHFGSCHNFVVLDSTRHFGICHNFVVLVMLMALMTLPNYVNK